MKYRRNFSRKNFILELGYLECSLLYIIHTKQGIFTVVTCMGSQWAFQVNDPPPPPFPPANFSFTFPFIPTLDRGRGMNEGGSSTSPKLGSTSRGGVGFKTKRTLLLQIWHSEPIYLNYLRLSPSPISHPIILGNLSPPPPQPPLTLGMTLRHTFYWLENNMRLR